MPGELVQMIVEVDNSQCQAPITSINISISNTVTMRSNGASTSDHKTIYSKMINGVPAGMSRKVNLNIIKGKRSDQRIVPTFVWTRNQANLFREAT